MATDMTVAKTILEQLGGNRFIVMTGSKNFIGSEDSLTFKIGGGTKNKISHCRITLTPMDEYNMEFLRMAKFTSKVVTSYEGIYCDQLQELFTEATGFYTRL